MGSTDQFTRREFQRILDVTDKQLSYWEKLGLLPARKSLEQHYDFRDLIGARTAKQLIDKGVSPTHLRRSLLALKKKLSEISTPLTELRILSDGRNIVVERGGARLEPISGQFMLNFETRELGNKVRVMREPSAADWFAAALEYEAASGSREAAEEAYERVLSLDAGHLDAMINLGMLQYEQGNLEKASSSFSRAIEVDPSSVIAHFNLGSVLEELGRLEDSRRHLRVAVRLDPGYEDAHYNLALVCDKLGADSEAREHWRAYLQLAPTSASASYARERLLSSASDEPLKAPMVVSKPMVAGKRGSTAGQPRQFPSGS